MQKVHLTGIRIRILLLHRLLFWHLLLVDIDPSQERILFLFDEGPFSLHDLHLILFSLGKTNRYEMLSPLQQLVHVVRLIFE